MKKILLALALALAPGLAWGQCTGVFPPNTVCGNNTGSPDVPRPIVGGGSGGGTPGGTSGQIQYNSSGVFGGFTMQGDCTLAVPNITCTKTGNVPFGTFATSNAATPPAIGSTTPAAGAFTTLSATGNLTTNVTGSTQCLHAGATGVVSGTGSDCGAGGGGTGTGTAGWAWTGNGASAPTFQPYVQSGGTNRTWQSKASDFVSVQDYGAIDDNSTDNFSFVQTAISAAQNGKTLYFPKNNTGIYLFNTGYNSSTVLFAGGPIRMVCAPGVWLKAGPGITTSQSMLYLNGTALLELQEVRTIIDGCNIGDPAATTRRGNNAIVFDTTAPANALFVMPIVQNLTITYASINTHSCWYNLQGCAILVLNSSSNTSGGTYGAVFQNCVCSGGINLWNAGDSNAIRNVFFPPDLSDPNVSNQGVYANLIVGAGGLVIDNVNCQILNGCLAVDNATSVFVTNINWEQISTNAEANASMADLGSSIINATGYVGPVVFLGGSIASEDCGNHPWLIVFNRVQGGYFDGMRLAVNCPSMPHPLMYLTSQSNNVGIGAGNIWLLNNLVVTDPAAKYSNAGLANYAVSVAAP